MASTRAAGDRPAQAPCQPTHRQPSPSFSAWAEEDLQAELRAVAAQLAAQHTADASLPEAEPSSDSVQSTPNQTQHGATSRPGPSDASRDKTSSPTSPHHPKPPKSPFNETAEPLRSGKGRISHELPSPVQQRLSARKGQDQGKIPAGSPQPAVRIFDRISAPAQPPDPRDSQPDKEEPGIRPDAANARDRQADVGLGSLGSPTATHLRSDSSPIFYNPPLLRSQSGQDLVDVWHSCRTSEEGGSPPSPVQQAPVLPFSVFAACRLLNTTPSSKGNGEVYEALSTMAACFLRADSAAVCDCIKAFGLNDLLWDLTQSVGAFRDGKRFHGMSAAECVVCKTAEQKTEQSGNQAHVHQHTPSSTAPGTSLDVLREAVGSLMHELEVVLHEYLSYNWHNLDDVYEANRHLLGENGLFCTWSKSLERQQSGAITIPASPPRPLGRFRHTYSDTSLAASVPGSMSNLSELDGASGGSDEMELDLESFDDFLAHRLSGQDLRHQGSSRSWTRGVSSASLHDSDSSQSTSKRRAAKNWRRAKVAVTRKITTDMLGVQRKFQTLQQMFNELNRHSSVKSASSKQRQPVVLLLGGGMAAGKSTVREIIGQDDFWTKVGKDAVVIEADAIKNRDVIYRSLERIESLDEADLSKYVHEYSTRAAESMLVTAVNQQKDIIFDGTMTWAPFVEQTIAMVRDFEHQYRTGPGYHKDDDGNVVERYWEQLPGGPMLDRQPYRIELVGVTCDAGLAVARGIWRKIRTGRSVPIDSQLRSHRLFSENWSRLAHQVDMATLYHTGSALTTFNKGGMDLDPKVIAHRSPKTQGDMLVNPAAYDEFCAKGQLHDQASCRASLYDKGSRCANAVPQSHDEQLSLLRQAFQCADRRERQQRRARGKVPSSHVEKSAVLGLPAQSRSAPDSPRR